MKITLLLILLSSTILSASGETGFEFLQFDKTTEELARNRNVGLSSNPMSGIFSNPVSLDALSKTAMVSTNFSLHLVDTKFFSALGAYSINDNQKTGFGIAVTDYGDFTKTSVENPYGDGTTFAVQEGIIQASYSYKINEKIVVGAAPLFAYQKYDSYSSSLLAINIGASYLFEEYMVAVNGKNLGMQLKTLTENAEKEKLPYIASIAFGNLSKARFNWEIDVTKIYKQQTQFGFSSKYHINRMFNFYTGVTITSDRISYIFDSIDADEYYFDESRLLSVGIELLYKDFNLLFAISYAGSAFAPITSFGLNYSF